MKPQQLNLFTGKTASQNIIDRLNEKIEKNGKEAKDMEMIRIKDFVK
jgi:hypothetical protein